MAHTVNLQPILSSTARTTSGQSNGYKLYGWSNGYFLINITAASGTGRKLTCYAQVSFNDSTYYTIGDAVEITATGQYALYTPWVGKYLRFNYNISGPSASFTFQTDFMGRD